MFARLTARSPPSCFLFLARVFAFAALASGTRKKCSRHLSVGLDLMTSFVRWDSKLKVTTYFEGKEKKVFIRSNIPRWLTRRTLVSSITVFIPLPKQVLWFRTFPCKGKGCLSFLLALSLRFAIRNNCVE